MSNSAKQQPPIMTLAARLKNRRIELGLGVGDFEGFSAGTIRAYESGSRVPSRYRLQLLSNILHINLCEDEDSDLPLPPYMNSAEAIRAILEHLAQGHISQAYENTLAFSRHASAMGNTHALAQADRLMKDIIHHSPASADIVTLPENMSPHDIEAIAGEAFVRQHWNTSLQLNHAIIQHLHVTNEELGRALRNRATIMQILGYFEGAVDGYNDALNHMIQHYHHNSNMILLTKLARASASFYAGEFLSEDLSPVIPLMGTSAPMWQMYWWVLGHQAWQESRWERLNAIRRASLRTFNPEWDPNTDHILAGLDAALAWQDQSQFSLTRLQNIGDSPLTESTLGLSAWLDLKADWVKLNIMMDSPTAFHEWAKHLIDLEHRGLYGWVEYFLQKAPQQINEQWKQDPRLIRIMRNHSNDTHVK